MTDWPDKGSIHSIETFGTLDGPGIRYVVFMQGCPLRCAFCHNPDTWQAGRGRSVELEWLVQDIKKYIPYFQASGGGVTVSGGEPLLQAEFLVDLFTRLARLQVHKAIDTSGFVEVAKVERLLTLTDLVMLSIKHPDPDRHLELTGHSPGRTQAFASYLTEIGKPTWIRYVIIPGVTDNLTDLGELSKMVSRMPNVARVELLPYNNLGLYKWSELGLGYRFSGIQPPTPEHMADLRKQMLDMLPRVPVL